ncbi:PIN domain-containing protein [Phormidesmis priestleyi]
MVSLRFLLDTNIVSELSRLQPNRFVTTKYVQNIEDIALASVTWHELLYGFHRLPTSRRKEELGFFLRQMIRPNVLVLDYGEAAAEWFASERARLTGLGRSPSYADGQIAAVAVANHLILVTRNVSDYSDFAGLAIENWFE